MPRVADHGGRGRRRDVVVGAGQYCIIKKIGSGAFSDVYSAEDQTSAARTKVALKKLNISNRNEVAEAKREVASMQKVEHFHIIRCHKMVSTATPHSLAFCGFLRLFAVC